MPFRFIAWWSTITWWTWRLDVQYRSWWSIQILARFAYRQKAALGVSQAQVLFGRVGDLEGVSHVLEEIESHSATGLRVFRHIFFNNLKSIPPFTELALFRKLILERIAILVRFAIYDVSYERGNLSLLRISNYAPPDMPLGTNNRVFRFRQPRPSLLFMTLATYPAFAWWVRKNSYFGQSYVSFSVNHWMCHP